MTQRRIPAAFIRGGTSKGVFFHERDLPKEPALRDQIFLDVIGSPDPYGRQLNGMGGGVSSLSKVVIIEQSDRVDADIDYTFVQVAIAEPLVDYGSMCGNLSSAVGPFAVDEGLMPDAESEQSTSGNATESETLVRVFNTNTQKIYHARFPVAGGKALVTGDQAIPGVSSTGARVALEYLDPGGSRTSGLLPTSHVRDTIELSNGEIIEASLVDATNPVVIVAASDFGCTAIEHPGSLEARADVMQRIEEVRRRAAVKMGLAATPETSPQSVPKIVLVADPAGFKDLTGQIHTAESVDISARAISMGQVHRALPLTLAMCLACACKIDGTVAHAHTRAALSEIDVATDADIRLGNPSGVIAAGADVFRAEDAGGKPPAWEVKICRVVRTQRRLMDGHVLCP